MQLLFDTNTIPKKVHEFGGELGVRKRKSQRPISTKHAIHIVLRANTSQGGSLLKFKSEIHPTLQKYSARFGTRLYKYAVVGNHLHLVMRFHTRSSYRAWIRTFTARLSHNFKIKWALRPFTRILNWGKDYVRCLKYVLQNSLVAEGLIPYKPRKVIHKYQHK